MQESKTDIIIIGAGGKVAGAAAQLFFNETDWHISLVSAREPSFDFQERDRLRRYKFSAVDFDDIRKLCADLRPKVIINAVAMTNVDACESERQLAHTLNVKVVENLIRSCRVVDAHLIHYSTDYIFNGQKGPYLEDDVPDPLNYYGKTKLAGENAIVTSKIPATILRTNIVYGLAPGVKTDFVTWVRDKCTSQERITIADDQFGNPTLCDDVALATMRVIEKGRTGIYNVAGGDYLDRFDFAKRIATFFNLSDENIVPVKTSELKLAAKRPLRAGLVTLKAETDLGVKPTTLQDGLHVYRRASDNLRHAPKAELS